MLLEINVKRKQGNFVIDAAFKGAGSGITALFGPSGAGKTSVVNMVAGLLRPDSGQITINGCCLLDSAKHINLPPERRRIGYVFQDGRLLPHLSVRSNLTYGMRLVRPDQRFVKFDPVVDLLGISHLLDRRPARLSGGEKQRVAIGRALLTSPTLLLMDEPLASLDAARKAEVLPFIIRLARKFSIPVLYVSHAMDEILNLADHMVLMDAGRVLASDCIEKLLSRTDFQSHLGQAQNVNVIPTVVDVPRDNFGLTHLRFGGGILRVRHFQAPRGAMVRVGIPASHVAIALESPCQTSFQNIFPGKIREIFDDGASFINVRMDIGSTICARITRQSCQHLCLKPDLPVYALIKSVSVSLGISPESTGYKNHLTRRPYSD
ncbi:MAG: molybdenum ABC transporter ATP-binding protein [Desulfobacterales bacterium]|nr:molybdenum ABC transporter ATP-binding protein [Desulfobacterales bacterium]MDD4073523.1 molybdenum ABC transporter ATP-binding protein [Desulfobacterales bacterium]MDD4391752.1 molybdenum ABC transporter ATP-binding protein [Desulfobacterales bacterium]